MSSSIPASIKSIPDDILLRWQDIVDTMAQILDVPIAIIARIEDPTYEVVRVNQQNTHGIQAGERLSLADIYCETVFKSREKLFIANALKEERWCNHPEVQAGLIAYLGFPIFLPTGKVFGTICVFDSKGNNFGELTEKFLLLFKDQIESHIQLMFERENLEQLVAARTKQLMQTNAQLNQKIAESENLYRQLLESKDQLQKVLENTQVGIAFTGRAGIIFQNPEYRRIFGWIVNSGEFPHFDHIHPEDRARIKDLYQCFAIKEQDGFDAEFRYHLPDTSTPPRNPLWVHCRAVHLREETGASLLLSAMDITRIKELEMMVHIQDKMSSLGRVAMGIAHEIRNPLSAINLYASAIEELLVVPDIQSHRANLSAITSKIMAASDRVQAIIQNVVDFAKPSTPFFIQTDLNQCIQKAVDLMSTTLRKASVFIELSLAARLPSCSADPAMIVQVLLNLLSNAVDAAAPGKGRCKIRISSAAAEPFIRVCVADSGPGIPEGMRSQIFEPFFTTKNEGSGIGLSLAHRIVTDHRGRLQATVSQWGGAEFILELPMEKS